MKVLKADTYILREQVNPGFEAVLREQGGSLRGPCPVVGNERGGWGWGLIQPLVTFQLNHHSYTGITWANITIVSKAWVLQ